jgi:hypothetical protein
MGRVSSSSSRKRISKVVLYVSVFCILALCILAFYFIKTQGTGYSIYGLEVIPTEEVNVSVGEVFNFTVGVHCLYAECSVINISLYSPLEDLVYVAHQDPGITSYSNDNGELSLVDEASVDEASAFGLWSDGRYLYVADGVQGIDVYDS